MEEIEQTENIKKALLKKALGYDDDEITEEYTLDENGDFVISKKKITKKHFAPDISASKALLENFSTDLDYEKMSEQDLIKEKNRLLKILKESEEGEQNDS